jgi:hypothetical protein
MKINTKVVFIICLIVNFMKKNFFTIITSIINNIHSNNAIAYENNYLEYMKGVFPELKVIK